MSDQALPLLKRLLLAARAFYRIIQDHEQAAAWIKIERQALLGRSTALADSPPDAALLLLSLLQKEGRLVDFAKQDLTRFSDEEVGAAARVVHQGCGQVLADYFRIAPVRDEPEGAQITLPAGFDPAATRPTGHLVGEPPFSGRLVHRGWRATEVRLPQVGTGHDQSIIAAAEVEL